MLGSNWLIFSPIGGQEYIEISRYHVVKSRFFKLNKRRNKFYFYSAKYWKRKIRSRLNDIFVVSISFLFFLDLISILFYLFQFPFNLISF